MGRNPQTALTITFIGEKKWLNQSYLKDVSNAKRLNRLTCLIRINLQKITIAILARIVQNLELKYGIKPKTANKELVNDIKYTIIRNVEEMLLIKHLRNTVTAENIKSTVKNIVSKTDTATRHTRLLQEQSKKAFLSVLSDCIVSIAMTMHKNTITTKDMLKSIDLTLFLFV